MDLIIREKDELESLDITAISDNWSGISEEQDLPIIQRIILHLIGRNISQDTKINLIISKINEIIEFCNQQGANIDNL